MKFILARRRYVDAIYENEISQNLTTVNINKCMTHKFLPLGLKDKPCKKRETSSSQHTMR